MRYTRVIPIPLHCKVIAAVFLTLAVAVLLPAWSFAQRSAKSLYDAPGSVGRIAVPKGESVVIYDFAFFAEDDIEVVLRGGQIDAIRPTGGKPTKVLQSYMTQWEGLSGAPAWMHFYSAKGKKTRSSILIVREAGAESNLVGPCLDGRGRLPDGLPVVCRGDSIKECFTFDEATPPGQNPLSPIIASGYQLPLLPDDSVPTAENRMMLWVGFPAAALIIGLVIMILRRRQRWNAAVG